MKTPTLCLSILILAGVGCSAEQPAPPRMPTAPAPAAQAIVSNRTRPERPTQVVISDEIRRACGLPESTTYFGFDSTRVSPRALEIIDKLARCFESGPLRGRSLHLAGYTDARGDADYNYLLGQRRADSVRDSLVKGGVKPDKVRTTSRGEDDARGADETSWALDRRVEVRMGG